MGITLDCLSGVGGSSPPGVAINTNRKGNTMFDWFTGLFGGTLPPEIKNEFSSAKVAKIAARAMTHPESLTMEEIKALAASVLTQRPNKIK